MKGALIVIISFCTSSTRPKKKKQKKVTRVGSVEKEKTPAQAEETECDDYTPCHLSVQFIFVIPTNDSCPTKRSSSLYI